MSVKYIILYSIDKIEESSRSLSNVELKSFINKFIEMLKLDYNLTRF